MVEALRFYDEEAKLKAQIIAEREEKEKALKAAEVEKSQKEAETEKVKTLKSLIKEILGDNFSREALAKKVGMSVEILKGL